MIELDPKAIPYIREGWPALKKTLKEMTPPIITMNGDEALMASALNHAAYETVIETIEGLINAQPDPVRQPFIDPNYEVSTQSPEEMK